MTKITRSSRSTCYVRQWNSINNDLGCVIKKAGIMCYAAAVDVFGNSFIWVPGSKQSWIGDNLWIAVPEDWSSRDCRLLNVHCNGVRLLCEQIFRFSRRELLVNLIGHAWALPHLLFFYDFWFRCARLAVSLLCFTHHHRNSASVGFTTLKFTYVFIVTRVSFISQGPRRRRRQRRPERQRDDKRRCRPQQRSRTDPQHIK